MAEPPRHGQSRDQSRGAEDGFTLVEALVAMVILAIASAGLIGAAQAHIDTIRGLETRAAAQFVAENRVVELTAGLPPEGGDVVDMLGRSWTVRVSERPSQDPNIKAMIVAVSPPGADEPLVTMDCFVERAPRA